MRNAFASVGLIVLAGCFTFVMVPDMDLPETFARAEEKGLPTIVLDPGHGGNDAGAIANGLQEKDLTLDIAQRAEEALQSYGFPTVLTRRSDTYVPLSARAQIANETPNSIFVSIHLNSHRLGSVSGVETFYSETKERAPNDWSWVGFFNNDEQEVDETGEILAGFIQAALVMKTDLRNRGIKSRSLYITRTVRRPAALVEAGFLSNSLEATLLKNDDYRQRLAAGIAEGVLSYYRSLPAEPADPARLANAGVE